MRVLLSLVFALSLAPIAQAHTVALTPDGSPDVQAQAWIDHSLMPSPDETLTLYRERCPSVEGEMSCTWRGGHVIYLAPGDGRAVFYHELGHQFEYAATDLLRGRFLQIMRERRPFISSPNSPHEQAAEAYRACSLYRSTRHLAERRFGYAYLASPHRHKLVCSMFRHEAARDGWS